MGGRHFTHFTETIGQSIALETAPTREATLTCYIGLADEQSRNPKRYALISRHLPFADNDDERYDYHKSAPKLHIIMPGDKTLKAAQEQIKGDIKSWEAHIAAVQEQPAKLTVAKEQLRKSMAFQAYLTSLQNPESRRVGHVVYSPARLPEPRMKAPDSLKNVGWLPDYAVVELNQARFRSRLSDLHNAVYLADLRGIVPLPLNENLGCDHYEFPEHNAPLRMRGVVPVAELHKPTSHMGRMDYTVNEYVLRVGKRGRSTGLTWGQGSEIDGVTRINVNGRDVKALHWPVQSIGRYAGPFSAPGDSGSALFTADGHLAAMIDGGCCRGLEKYDLTYATPLEWVREHIKKHAFPPVIFP
jgi:hypothetical protein